MSSPTVTYKAFLDTVTADLVAAFTTIKVRSTIAPRFGLPMNQPMLNVCPGDNCIEYEPCDAEDKTGQAYWVWYDCRIYGLVALTDANYEDALTGSAAKSGIVKVMEDLYTHLVGNFMALSQVREAKVIWDKPSFFPASFEGEGVNLYAAMGSLVYKVKLKQLVSTEYQASPPAITNVASTIPTTTAVTIMFTTNKLGTTKIKYGTSPYPGSWTSEKADATFVTSHSIELTGLTAETVYYLRPWSQSKEGWWGQTADTYTFTTDTVGNGGGKVLDEYPRND
jgi:hypothetical protein